MVKYARIASINEKAADPQEFIRLAEDNYEAYIKEAAMMVADTPSKPVVLLSGPSGSGKTTAALRIERELKNMGKAVHTLSMDNYFLPITEESRKELPKDEFGNIDLESPHRLDISLFAEHLKLLAEGEPFDMPLFDFATQSRPGYVPMCRKKDEIIIIEGIHALNPLVTGDSDKFATCMYVSVRTRLCSEDGTLLHPRHIRLMRRLCRDNFFRKRSYHDICAMFESVSRGEDLYITPFKSRADYDIDTFMAYEPSVYKGFIEKEFAVHENDGSLDGFPEIGRIKKVLGELSVIDSENVPSTSLVREFIGGSELNY
ncbi:MAG: uridine kinase [Huintestinicola sp.]